MSKVSNDIGETVRDGKSAAKSVVDQASQKAADMAGRVRDAGSDAAGYVRDQYGHISEEAHQAYDRAKSQAQEWEQSAEDYVQNRPLQAILIAAGVGLLFGLLWKRR